MTGPTPLLDLFKRGEAPRDVRLMAAQGVLAPRAHEQLSMLVLLTDDADTEIRQVASDTIGRLPEAGLRGFLARSDVPTGLREFFAARGILPGERPSDSEDDAPLIDVDTESADLIGPPEVSQAEARAGVVQRLTAMSFTERLRAAVKGTREMRAILVRDPNKMIAAAVLSSPKLTESEVETFARTPNLPEDVLRIIGSNRAWMRNYGVVVGLTRNPKTPLAMSLNLLARLQDRDVSMLSVDRNIPEPLRIAARKKVVDGASRRG